MKKFNLNCLLIVFVLLFGNSLFAVVTPVSTVDAEIKSQMMDLGPKLQNLSVEDFLNLTPKKYKKLTGKKMGIKNALKLKAAKTVIKRQQRKAGANIEPGIYILLAILGLGWLAMGLLSDWSGSDWIVNLVLTILCWLPGLIHALIKKKDFY